MSRAVYDVVKPAAITMYEAGDLNEQEWESLKIIDASVRTAFNAAVVALQAYEASNGSDKEAESELEKAFAEFEIAYNALCEILGDRIENKRILYIGDLAIALIRAWRIDSSQEIEKMEASNG
jgi:hypothetical protein